LAKLFINFCWNQQRIDVNPSERYRKGILVETNTTSKVQMAWLPSICKCIRAWKCRYVYI